MSPAPQSIERGLDYAALRYEKTRLETFSAWPQDAPVAKVSLAKAGFFFKAAPQLVECFSCGGTVGEWRLDEQAMRKHRALFPACPFVNELSENVPLVQLSTQTPPPRPEDSGYSSTGSSHSPVSSQDSNGSTSPSSGFRYPVVASRLSPESTTSSSADAHLLAVDDEEDDELRRQQLSPTPAVPAGITGLRGYAFLARERMRLRTFSDWAYETTVSGQQLARAGFVCMDDGDKAQCVFCRGIVGNWEAGDSAMDEHRRHFPLCPYMRGCRVGNVSLEHDADDSEGDEQEHQEEGMRRRANTVASPFRVPPNLVAGGEDTVGWRIDYRTNSGAENASAAYPLSAALNVRTTDGCQITTPSQLGELGVSQYHAPLHPSHATVEARLRSFRYWPPALSQKPRQLADAGFFYVGVSDHVKCFHCDGGLRNWVPGDDPWVEHARWFANCGFVRLIKGSDYVRCVLRDHPCDPAPPQEESGGEGGGGGVSLQQQRERQRDEMISEQQLEAMMKTAICETAIQLGLPRETVKRALRLQLEATGVPFTDVSGVLTAVGLDQGVDDSLEDPTVAEASTSTAMQQDDDDDEDEELQRLAHRRADSTASSGADSGLEEGRGGELGCGGVKSCEAGVGAEMAHLSLVKPPSDHHLPTITERAAVATTAPSAPSDEEFRRLRDQKQCKVCMDNDVGVVFLPCGHLITCVSCAPALRDCPLCRQQIRGTVRTYLS